MYFSLFGSKEKYQKKSRPQLGPPAADCPCETHARGVGTNSHIRALKQRADRNPRAHASLGCAATGFKTRKRGFKTGAMNQRTRGKARPSKGGYLYAKNNPDTDGCICACSGFALWRSE